MSKEIPVTAALAQIIQSSFPEEYEARRQEERALFSAQEGGEQPLPLFVMTSIFPGKPLPPWSCEVATPWEVIRATGRNFCGGEDGWDF